jgi:hypothetical protein
VTAPNAAVVPAHHQRTGGEEGAADPTMVVVRFAPTVRITKQEAFAACQALADADRALLQSGRLAEARALGDLFELFEERLVACPE